MSKPNLDTLAASGTKMKIPVGNLHRNKYRISPLVVLGECLWNSSL